MAVTKTTTSSSAPKTSSRMSETRSSMGLFSSDGAYGEKICQTGNASIYLPYREDIKKHDLSGQSSPLRTLMTVSVLSQTCSSILRFLAKVIVIPGDYYNLLLRARVLVFGICN